MPPTESHVTMIGLPHAPPSPGRKDTIAIGRTRRHAHQPGVSFAPPSPPSSPPRPLKSFTTPTLA